MPRQRTHYSGVTYTFPGNFPQRLARLQQESGLPWAELTRRLDVDPETVRRWRTKGIWPSTRHYVALLTVAESLGLADLFRV